MKKSKKPYDKQNHKHGYWEVYFEMDEKNYAKGDLWYKCIYHHGLEVGLDIWNINNGSQRKTYWIR